VSTELRAMNVGDLAKGISASKDVARFASKVVVDVTSGCWLWNAAKCWGGYARFSCGKRIVAGHRWAWEQRNGPVPEGLQLDHLCRTRHCVNPEHLQPVTLEENARRGAVARAETETPRREKPRSKRFKWRGKWRLA